jgi:predicted dehydrogenase
MRRVTGPRVAIAGVGFIGAVHARAALVNGGRLVGVTASSAARARNAAAAFGAERAFASSEELVVAADVDVVHICTPNDLHAPLARAALAAGKHVICEKPLATDLTDALELVRAARAADAVAAVPFAYRYYPLVREARARVAAGEIGRVHLVHGAYLQDWLLRPEATNWRVDPARGGRSRAFADVGSHWCDLMELVTGERIAAVSAQLRTVVPSRPAAGGGRASVATEDIAVVLFRTASDVVGSVVVSQVSAGRANQLVLEVAGGEGSLAFDQQTPETLRLARGGTVELLERDPARLDASAARYATLPAGHPQGFHDCMQAFVGEVYAAIRERHAIDGLPSFADGARAVALTEAVLASAADEGAWTPVAASAPIGTDDDRDAV